MPQIYGITRRAQPTKTADASQQQVRVGGYGDIYAFQMGDDHVALADEGSYFTATNPTAGTAITHATTGAFSATAALFCLSNGDSEGGKRIYLDYVNLLVVGTPTTASSAELLITIDNTNRFSSGGSTITPKNVNMDSSTATIATLNFGAVVLTAASGSVRQIHRAKLKTQAAPCLVAGDVISTSFGGDVMNTGAAAGSTAQILAQRLGPCIIGGGDSINFHVWYPSVTVAPTFELSMAWWER